MTSSVTGQQREVLEYDDRVAFAEELTELAAADERVVAVCNDSVGSSKLTGFQDRFPDRLINVGIAEQDMVGVSAGLANMGFLPFVCSASPFLTGRSLEQLKVDVAYNGLPVALCGMSPGVAYGPLGATHHSIEDLSWLRALPAIDIVVPADRAQTRAAVRLAVSDPRPRFIRVGRIKVPDLEHEGGSLQRGRFQKLRDGSDLTVIAAGTMVSRALDAADRLGREGLSVRVLNASYLAPLDDKAITDAAQQTRAIVTVEEAVVSGGLGAAVGAVVLQQPASGRVPVEMLGFGGFVPTGPVDFLFEINSLTPDGIAQAARRALAR